ncbi:MAG: S-adenosylmethionine decarboxylase family protein [Methylophagaceae bacterium]|jgi:S-adenosylmethionine/arginine decarboxylase-like enzyme|tara:strand:+ start:1117 stop:1488 length:372 start_codon:yes stop_codon:yes gene_type:complete
MKLLEHKHLIIRTEVNNPPRDEVWLQNWLTELVDKIGMKVCRGPITAYVDMPGNEGLTGVVVIETSHIAIHVWDAVEPALVQLDVYTCGALNKDIIFAELEQWDPVKIEWKYLDREFGLNEVK